MDMIDFRHIIFVTCFVFCGSIMNNQRLYNNRSTRKLLFFRDDDILNKYTNKIIFVQKNK